MVLVIIVITMLHSNWAVDMSDLDESSVEACRRRSRRPSKEPTTGPATEEVEDCLSKVPSSSSDESPSYEATYMPSDETSKRRKPTHLQTRRHHHSKKPSPSG